MLSRHSIRGAHKAASSAASAPSESLTKLKSGLTVASIDSNGPVSQLVLAFRAGSRFEQQGQAGLVHHARNFVGRDTTNYPGTSVVWSAAAAGGVLKSFATRDLFGVSLTVPRDQTSQALSILGHVAAQPAFKPWELEDVLPLLRADIAYRQPIEILFEDLHRAAYRNGSLGNSVYAADTQIGKISTDTLSSFAGKHFVAGNGILFATNVDHENLVLYGDNHAPINEGGAVAASASPYKGGDVHRAGPGKLAYVIVAGEGAAASNPKGLAAQAVLLQILGTTPAVSFASVPAGILGKAVGSTGSASAFQAVHSDSGLVGAYVVAEGAQAGNAVSSVAAAIKNFKATDIEVAKKKALNDALRARAHSDQLSFERVSQLLASSGNIVDLIPLVTPGEVDAAAKKLASKLTVASYGDISNVPYSDSL